MADQPDIHTHSTHDRGPGPRDPNIAYSEAGRPAGTHGPGVHRDADRDRGFLSRISWGSIIAGAVLSTVITFMLTLLGIGIGLVATDTVAGIDEFATGTGIWWVISGLVALFAGGWVAARLANQPDRTDGLLHGLVTWGTQTVFSLWLAATVLGTAFSGAFSVASSAVSATGDVAVAAGNVAGGGLSAASNIDVPWQQIQGTVTQRLEEAGVNVDQIDPQQVASRLRTLADQDPATINQQDRQALIDLVANNSDLSQQEAEQAADRLVQQYRDTYQRVEDRVASAAQDVRQTASQAMDDVQYAARETVDTVGGATIWLFVAMLLGAAAAAAGGAVGAPDPDDVRRRAATGR